jgi:glutamyl-tRNA reductase
MTVAVIGVNHRSAPIEVRERLAWPSTEVPHILERLAGDQARPVALLSTCNRVEFYLDAVSPGAYDAVWGIADERLGEPMAPYAYVHEGQDAVRHVFRVTAGLDSMILGEAQVQGQVRDAWETARGHAGPVLARLLQTALRVGGRVREETTIGRGAASVPSAAVDLARNVLGDLRDRNALVLGTGDMSELGMACLMDEGVEAVIVAHESLEHARALAERFDGAAILFEDAWERFATADIVLCATSAPHAVVTPRKIQDAVELRGGRPLCVLDIAVPRDVDPAVGDLPGVFLYDIDDIQGVVDSTLSSRRERVEEADRIIAQEANRFWSWYRARGAVDLIRDLRDGAEEIRRRELSRALRKLEHLSVEDRERVEYLTKTIMQRFLHAPSVRLRGAAGQGREAAMVEALRFAFDLGDATTPDTEMGEGESG